MKDIYLIIPYQGRGNKQQKFFFQNYINKAKEGNLSKVL